jgi:tight adherence protein C
MKILYYLILALVGTAAYLFSDAVLGFNVRPRLRPLVDKSSRKIPTASEIKFLRPLIRLTQPIANLPYLQKLKTQTEVLRINLDLPGLVLIKVFLSIVAGVAVTVLTKQSGYGIMALLVGFLIPDFIFMNKIRAKRQEISRIFPETIDLIDLCIGAGLDFTASLRWVIEKSDTNAFIEQLSIVLNEIQVGRNRSEALKNMSKRLQLTDINSFVRTVIQSERMGTSVEEAFRNLSEDTRLMRYQNGERYAIKASLKILFPLLFCILPVIMIIVAGPIIIKFTEGELIPKTF